MDLNWAEGIDNHGELVIIIHRLRLEMRAGIIIKITGGQTRGVRYAGDQLVLQAIWIGEQ